MTLYRPFLRAFPVWPAALASQMNIWISFHANLTVAAGDRATLRIAAAQAYRIWVNGEFAGRGPARTAHRHARVDEWPALADPTGRLDVIIEVMGYGVPTFCSTDEPAFCCDEVAIDGKAVAWTAARGGGFVAERRAERIQRVERYSYQRAFAESYRIGAAGLTWMEAGYEPVRPIAVAKVNFRRTWLERGVAYPDLSVAQPLTAAAKGKAAPFSAKFAAKTTQWRHIFEVPKTSRGFKVAQLDWPLFQTLAGARLTTTGPTKLGAGTVTTLTTRNWIRADFGADFTGFPALKVKALTATRVILTFEEILVDGELKFDRSSCVNAISLDLAAGTEIDFEAFEPYTLRYLQVMAWTGKAEVSHLRLRHYRNGTELRAAPPGLTPAEAIVRRAALSSYRQNVLDIYMDCPSRERAGWLCDSMFTARAEWHLTGDNVIERAFLENYLVPKKFDGLPAGMVPMCYPAEPLADQFIPNWALFYIIQLDEAQRTRHLPPAWQPLIERSVKGLLRYFRRFENELGLLEKLESWVFVEWSKANEFVQDVNFPSNMLYAMALRSAARLLGDPRLTAQAEKIDATVRELAWREGRFVDNAVRDKQGKLVVTEHASEVCQYYAFFTGLASPQRETALWRRLVRADYGALYPANVFVGKIMRFQLLLANGEHAAAKREVLKNYVPMAKMTGTLWELFEKNVSCNHGFTSYIAVLIDQMGPR
jgi:alpha-L-rhamnosidase